MAIRINFLKPLQRHAPAAGDSFTEVGMAKVIIGAIVASLISIFGVTMLSSRVAQEQGPLGDAWPAIVRAQLTLAKPLEKQGLATVVALAEELYWLRRAEMAYESKLTSLMRQAEHLASAGDDSEGKALSFLIARVTASLGLELDRWQTQMGRVAALGASEQDAALRILAFAKWQQKGGAYEYAYDFFQQLSNNAVVVPVKEPSPPPPPPPTATTVPRPVVRRPAPKRPTPISDQEPATPIARSQPTASRP